MLGLPIDFKGAYAPLKSMVAMGPASYVVSHHDLPLQ